MSQVRTRWLLAACFALVACWGCGSSGSSAGTGGFGGTGGIGGAPCDVEAVEACLELQECCRAILVNPVFFQSCNSVVLQCDAAQCTELLSGYVRCQSDEP